MKTCKLFNKSDKEIATILIWAENNHKVGMILQVPYVVNVIKDAYHVNVTDDEITADLLNKVNLVDIKVQCN